MTRSRRRRSLAASPGFIPPQLATLVTQAPDGPGFAHEIKLDGYRMAARLDSGDVCLLTRTGLDWSSKYPVIAEALAELPATTAYLDGELCGSGAGRKGNHGERESDGLRLVRHVSSNVTGQRRDYMFGGSSV